MFRVVIDPGVFVSALIAPKGAPAQVLDLLLEQRFELVGVDLLVSGDRDLTELEGAPVQIATPRELLDRLNTPM